MSFFSSKKFDLVSIGDIAIDAFIRIKDASINCDLEKKNCKLCFGFGDKTPYEYVEEVPAVGNAANASVAAARLGLRSALVASLGNDAYGLKCRDTLKKEKVETKFLHSCHGKQTNYHYVLWFGDDRTILIKHNEYDYELPRIGKPKWIYLSSLSKNSLIYHEEIVSYLDKNPEVKLAFQPGTYQIKFGTEKIKKVYRRTEIFFSNVDEAARILGVAGNRDLKYLCQKIKTLGPKTVVLTDEIKGAYMYHQDILYFLPPYPDRKPPIERTGAGDAFSATFVSALALDKSYEEAFMWGPINSMSVVEHIGAQKGLLTQSQIQQFLKNAPPEYKMEKIV